MHKKIMVSLTATATAFSLMVAPSLTAFAEGDVTPAATTESSTEAAVASSTTSEIASQTTPAAAPETAPETKYEDKTTPVTASSSNTPVNVGNVTTKDGETAVSAYGENVVANIHGNVDASGTKEYQNSDGTVKYRGATGVQASDDATVNVEGNVVGGTNGVSAYDNSTVNVSGNVTATGTDNTVYTWNEETQKYDIPKNTVTGEGITTNGDADIHVKGDVNGVTCGILVNPDNDNSNGSIVVEGEITASGEHADGIQISKTSSSYGGIDFDNIDDALNDVPDITIYKIDAPDPVTVTLTTSDSSTYKDVRKKVIESINYIVKQDLEAKTNYDLKVSGTKQNSGFDTVNLNQVFTAAANLPSGYEIYAGENVKVNPNGDGSFNLSLTNVRGGIYVTARLIPVTNSDGTTSYVVSTESANNESSDRDNSSDNSQAPTGAIVISNTAASAEAAAASVAISGDKPARMVSFDLGKVTPKQYKDSIISNIAAAPAGGALNIETDRVSCFDSKMLQAIADHPTIDVNVVFMHNGKKLKVTIPAGYDTTKLLDEFGYCGFLRLASILGSTEL